MAQHDRDLFDPGGVKIIDNGLQETSTIVSEQGLVATHAPGFSGSENQPGNHVVCWAFGL
jgi:hypothetical protein